MLKEQKEKQLKIMQQEKIAKNSRNRTCQLY